MASYVRCEECYLFKPLCLCGEVEKISDLPFKLHLFIHLNEWKKSSNSAQLAEKCISNCEKTIYGLSHEKYCWENLGSDVKKGFILFPQMGVPFENGVDLRNYIFEGSLSKGEGEGEAPLIIVPDGNWRQAKEMAKEIFINKGYKFINIPNSLISKSSYKLRTHSNKNFLSTFEAIMMLVKLLDPKGDEKVISLEKTFHQFVERSLLARGLVKESDVFWTDKTLLKLARQSLKNN